MRKINQTLDFIPLNIAILTVSDTRKLDGDKFGQHVRQPAEGLGFDRSSVAHIWRTMIWPNYIL